MIDQGSKAILGRILAGENKILNHCSTEDTKLREGRRLGFRLEQGGELRAGIGSGRVSMAASVFFLRPIPFFFPLRVLCASVVNPSSVTPGCGEYS